MSSQEGATEPATLAGAGAPAPFDAPDSDPSPPVTGLAELGRQRAEHERLWQVIERINQGVGVEEILDFVYDEFRGLVPFNRLSYAVVESTTGLIVARWTRSDGAAVKVCNRHCGLMMSTGSISLSSTVTECVMGAETHE